MNAGGVNLSVHVKVACAGLRVVTENRKLLALERSRCPVIRQVELAAQLRPGHTISAVKQSAQVLDEIQARAEIDCGVCERRGGYGRRCGVVAVVSMGTIKFMLKL